MILKFNYKRNLHQTEFHNDVKTKFLHLSAGYGAGKTYALCMKLFHLSFLNRNLAGGLICPSYSDFKKDVLPTIEGILDSRQIRFSYHQTDHFFFFPWSNAKIYVATGERKLRGPNWAFACINELTLMPIERYREVIGRVRVRHATHPQIASVGTPEGISSPYFTSFIESPMKNSKVIYGSTEENAINLDPSYVDSMKDSYDEKSLRAYLYGEWINMGSQLFYYSYDPAVNDDKQIKEDTYAPVHVSLDFNVDPMAATVWQYDGRHLKAVNQIKLNDADTNKLAVALKARGYTPDRSILYPDPAGNARSTKGQPDIVILKNHGFTEIRVRSKAPGMRQRQLNVNNLLSKGTIRINPDLAPGIKKDLLGVEQDKVTLEKVKKNPELTHFSDGLDYLCDILFPYSGSRPQRSTVIEVR